MKSDQQLEMDYPGLIRKSGRRDDAILPDRDYIDIITQLQNQGYRVRRVTRLDDNYTISSLERG